MKWISASESLPDDHVRVLIWGEGNDIAIGWYDSRYNPIEAGFVMEVCNRFDGASDEIQEWVTHWSALPETPKS